MCVLLAMHLCGALSVRAIDVFHNTPSIRHIILCPCCLPNQADPSSPKSLYASSCAAEQYQATARRPSPHHQHEPQHYSSPPAREPQRKARYQPARDRFAKGGAHAGLEYEAAPDRFTARENSFHYC